MHYITKSIVRIFSILTLQVCVCSTVCFSERPEFLDEEEPQGIPCLRQDTKIPVGGCVYIDRNGATVLEILKFGEKFLDAANFAPLTISTPGKQEAVIYENAATTWIGNMPMTKSNSGTLCLLNGESIVLDEGLFKLETMTENDLTLKYKNSFIRIPVKEILSLVLPKK